MAYEKKTQTQRERSDCVAHAVHLKPLQSCMSIISQEKKRYTDDGKKHIKKKPEKNRALVN